MNLFTGEASEAFFGSEVPAALQPLLREAREAPPAERASRLWAAQACAPQALAVYYLLYKHHAGRREFALAERAARAGLAEAARQAALPADWRDVQALDGPADQGPRRFWLFTLKALAFIRLRSGDTDEARALLARLAQLDPPGAVGGEVVARLLEAAQR